MPTPEIHLIAEAKKEIDKAMWAGDLQYADEGNFDDLKARDKYVMECVTNAIKTLQQYQAKIRPIQTGKRLRKRPGQRKTIFD